jgi:hypothetical protein
MKGSGEEMTTELNPEERAEGKDEGKKGYIKYYKSR